MSETLHVSIESIRYQQGEIYWDKSEFEFESMKNVARCILTYKPKRGYKIDSIKINSIETLV